MLEKLIENSDLIIFVVVCLLVQYAIIWYTRMK